MAREPSFTIYIPTVEAVINEEKTEDVILQEGKEHILLVDDELPLLLVGKKTLKYLGYQVTTMQNSLEALETFKDTPTRFDLVLTDLTMPRMTGLQLAEEILKIRPDIPIILNSGNNEPGRSGKS